MPRDILTLSTNKYNLLFFITKLMSLINPINNVGQRELVTEVGDEMMDPTFTT